MSESDNLDQIRIKLDLLYDMLSPLLIEADLLTKTKGLNENTISRNNKIEKFNQFGKRKLLIKLESVPVIKNRKRTQTGTKSSAK